jgi:hypothetical protein
MFSHVSSFLHPLALSNRNQHTADREWLAEIHFQAYSKVIFEAWLAKNGQLPIPAAARYDS